MSIDKTTWPLRWSHGHGEVQALGGMLGPVHFNIAPHRQVQPFAVFPWADEEAPSKEQALTGLLARGRGEWPCVPFGLAPDAGALGWNHPIHGESAHASWTRIDDASDDSYIQLRFDYADTSPIDYLVREISCVHGQPEIRCRLTVHVKSDCLLPVGLHPVLKMPAAPGALQLIPGAFQFARSYPTEVELGADLLQSDFQFQDLAKVATRQGHHIDLLNFPLAEKTESLVQLCGVDGRMTVINFEENYAFELQWDAQILPSCVLWISNGGRQSWPWNGRHFGLGIEPVCAYFDTGVQASVQANPISAQGVSTSISLKHKKPLVLDHVMRLRAATEVAH